MKKLLVALLALVVVGGFVFAQDAKPVATFGQYMDVSTTYDSTGFAYDVYNETYFNYAAKDMGFSATVVSGADLFASPRNYAIYYNAFNGMLGLRAGVLRETGSARLTSVIDGNGFSTRLANVKSGILATLKPVAGLTVAAFVPATGAANNGDFNNINFGAAYNVTDVANLVASYRMENKELAVGADIKAIKDVTAKVGYKMVQGTSTSTSYVFVTGGTTVSGLTLNLDADVVLASTLGYGAKVQAEYAMDPYALGVKASYDNGSDAWYANNGIDLNPYAMMNFAAGDIKVGFDYNTGTSKWSLPIEFELSY